MYAKQRDKYLFGDYLNHNPTWHSEDSMWKAQNVLAALAKRNIVPDTVCEVGCGSGGVLAALRNKLPDVKLYGFDISPDVQVFWNDHSSQNISFTRGDFFEENQLYYDLIMLLDVFEHVSNPWQFLEGLHGHGKWFVFHVPLEFTALGAIRERALLCARKSVGHIHYYSPSLALSLLEESGFEVVEHDFTQAFKTAPNRSFKTRLANIPRTLISMINKSLNARLLGGDTLLILAKSAENRK